jgi:hypothetical protein
MASRASAKVYAASHWTTNGVLDVQTNVLTLPV